MQSHQLSNSFERWVTTARSLEYDPPQRHAAFAQLVLQFRGMALTYAYHLLGDEQLAQDATQEAFLTAYQRLEQLREPAAFSGWLRRIVHTQCHRLTRAKRPASVPLEVLDSALSDSTLSGNGDLAQLLADEDAAQSMVARVLDAVAALPEDQRIVVRLFYFDSYSIRDVAQTLDLPVTTIKKRLQYARDRLRKQLMNSVRPAGMTVQALAVQMLAVQTGQWLLPLFTVAVVKPERCAVAATNPRWPQ